MSSTGEVRTPQVAPQGAPRGVRIMRQRGPDGRHAAAGWDQMTRSGVVAARDLAPIATGPVDSVLDSTHITPELRRAASSRRGLMHRPRALLLAEVLATLGMGVVLTGYLGLQPVVAAGVVLLCMVTRFHSGRASIRVGLPRIGPLATDMALPFAAVGLGVAFGGLAPGDLRDAATLILGITGVTAAATVTRHRLEQPVRIVIVGDRVAIAKAATRWAGDRQAKVVAGLLLDDHDDHPPVSSTLGVRTIRGIDEVAEWVDRWAVDLVVVAPGPGVDAQSVRRLGWLLEDSDASLAVMGVLDSVDPHRIESTVLSGATLIHARSSRPSSYIRGSKWVFDRIVGTLLLLAVSPLLGVLCLWIRRETGASGLFTQTRTGKDGKPFTIYKLRTMRADAEATKAQLVGSDEGNGVLFKVHADPRITRSGRILRKTSIDELPQLINVVLGQMSLVGPRPALPSEVAAYDDLARRRLAVRPGMTGLWQVSGRSDLSWEESVELDVRYTDNYRLSDDLLIGLRTVDAVTRARGAY